MTENPAVRPYNFGSGTYENAEALARALQDDWNEALNHMARGYIGTWIKEDLRDQEISVGYDELMEQNYLKPDLTLFYLITLLGPGLVPKYKSFTLSLLAIQEISDDLSFGSADFVEILDDVFEFDLLGAAAELLDDEALKSVNEEWWKESRLMIESQYRWFIDPEASKDEFNIRGGCLAGFLIVKDGESQEVPEDVFVKENCPDGKCSDSIVGDSIFGKRRTIILGLVANPDVFAARKNQYKEPRQETGKSFYETAMERAWFAAYINGPDITPGKLVAEHEALFYAYGEALTVEEKRQHEVEKAQEGKRLAAERQKMEQQNAVALRKNIRTLIKFGAPIAVVIIVIASVANFLESRRLEAETRALEAETKCFEHPTSGCLAEDALPKSILNDIRMAIPTGQVKTSKDVEALQKTIAAPNNINGSKEDEKLLTETDVEVSREVDIWLHAADIAVSKKDANAAGELLARGVQVSASGWMPTLALYSDPRVHRIVKLTASPIATALRENLIKTASSDMVSLPKIISMFAALRDQRAVNEIAGDWTNRHEEELKQRTEKRNRTFANGWPRMQEQLVPTSIRNDVRSGSFYSATNRAESVSLGSKSSRGMLTIVEAYSMIAHEAAFKGETTIGKDLANRAANAIKVDGTGSVASNLTPYLRYGWVLSGIISGRARAGDFQDARRWLGHLNTMRSRAFQKAKQGYSWEIDRTAKNWKAFLQLVVKDLELISNLLESQGDITKARQAVALTVEVLATNLSWLPPTAANSMQLNRAKFGPEAIKTGYEQVVSTSNLAKRELSTDIPTDPVLEAKYHFINGDREKALETLRLRPIGSVSGLVVVRTYLSGGMVNEALKKISEILITEVASVSPGQRLKKERDVLIKLSSLVARAETIKGEN